MTTAAKRSRSFGWGRIEPPSIWHHGQPGSNSRERRTQKEGNASEHVYPNGDLSSVWRSFTLLCLSELLKMASWWENGGIPPLAVAELLMTIERRWHSCGSVTQAPTYERSWPPRSPDCPAKPLILRRRLGGSTSAIQTPKELQTTVKGLLEVWTLTLWYNSELIHELIPIEWFLAWVFELIGMKIKKTIKSELNRINSLESNRFGVDLTHFMSTLLDSRGIKHYSNRKKRHSNDFEANFSCTFSSVLSQNRTFFFWIIS